MHLTPDSAVVPLYAYLLAVWHRGNQQVWHIQRGLAHPEAHHALPPLGRLGLRPRTLIIYKYRLAVMQAYFFELKITYFALN